MAALLVPLLHRPVLTRPALFIRRRFGTGPADHPDPVVMDTHEMIEKLHAGGLPQQAAVAVVECISHMLKRYTKGIKDIQAVEFSHFKRALEKIDLRVSETEGKDHNLAKEIAAIEVKTIKYIVGTFLTAGGLALALWDKVSGPRPPSPPQAPSHPPAPSPTHTPSHPPAPSPTHTPSHPPVQPASEAHAASALLNFCENRTQGILTPYLDGIVSKLLVLLQNGKQRVQEEAVSALASVADSSEELFEKYYDAVMPFLKAIMMNATDRSNRMLHAKAIECISFVGIAVGKVKFRDDAKQLAGSHLSESQVKCVVDQIKAVIIASASRKKERAKRTKAEDFDAEEGEMLNEENEQEEDMFYQVGNCLGTLIKTFKASFIPYFDELSVYITPMLDKDKTTEERRTAICIFDDVVEQCQEAALKYYDAYLPFILEACNDENADVRQAALYGVGLCAEFGGYVFRPLLGEVLLRLNNMIRHPDALHPDNVMAYDNAVSALGKICKFHPNSIDLAEVFPVWLSCLPIRNDLIEAKIVHEQLCSMVERSDGDLLGPNNQHISNIVSVFAEVLYGGKDLATEQTISRIVNFLRQLRQTLPPSVLTSTWSTLQPQQQLALQSVLSP